MIELIVVTAVFSISAAVCLRIFFLSHQLTVESRNLSHASIEVQSAADCYKAAGGDILATADLLGAQLDPNGALLMHYDDLWKRVYESEAASFSVSVREAEQGYSVVTAEKAGGAAIFSVNVRGDIKLG
ncbi:MAG: type II secretion system GspH family protein [Oscillospiraceae bacterium]|nr:type II secretion system GspH family protein [Oscillospiraceae bacterium]